MPNPTPLPHWLSRLKLRRAGVAELSTTIRRAIAEGLAQRGSRLPTSRDLAMQLRVARSTIVAAYEALAQEGLLESRGRRGTFVAPDRRLTPISAS